MSVSNIPISLLNMRIRNKFETDQTKFGKTASSTKLTNEGGMLVISLLQIISYGWSRTVISLLQLLVL